LRDLHTLLHTEHTAALGQLLVMGGLGGIGKTQTALEYAYQHRHDYQTIFWVRASTREEIISDYTNLARLLKLPEQNAQDPQLIVNAIKRWLHQHTKWLLILDNADDLEMVVPYLPDAATGHIILTTRARATGNIARKIELPTMPQSEGALLLLRRAKLIAPDASLESVSAEDRAIAEAIVTELGGLPLAIDQAGAYIEETGESLAGYLTLYREQRKDLLARRGGIHADHVAVATTWNLAFKQIESTNPAAIDLMKLCAFLAPDAIAEEMLIEGARYVSPALQQAAENKVQWNEMIKDLLKYSLLDRQAKAQTLSLHRLVQAVIYDAMDESTQREWVERGVRVVVRVFPYDEIAPWLKSRRYVRDALFCLEHADRLHLENGAVQRLCFNVASYLHNLGQHSIAEEFYRWVLESQERLLGEKHPDTFRTRHNLALLYSDQGRYGEAEMLYKRILTNREKLLGEEHPDILVTKYNLAALYVKRGKYEEAERLYRQVLESRKRLLGEEHLDTLLALHGLATLYYYQGKYEEAETLYKQVLESWEQQLGAGHPNTLPAQHNLGLLYAMQGKYEEAEKLLRRVLMSQERLLGEKHPDTLLVWHSLALLYAMQGKYEEAEKLLRRVLMSQERLLGEKHPDTLLVWHSLALLYKDQGKYKEAEKLHQQVLESRKRLLGEEHLDTLLALHGLATLYYYQGKYEEAETLYKQVLESWEQQLGAGHPNTLLAQRNLALLYADQQKYEEAEKLLQQALLNQKRVLGAEHPEAQKTREALDILRQATQKERQAGEPGDREDTISQDETEG
jgi:tetratricopeptide (TPR) repeat protein